MKPAKNLIKEIAEHANDPELRSKYSFDRWTTKFADKKLAKSMNLNHNQILTRSIVLTKYKSNESMQDNFLLAMLWGGLRKNHYRKASSINSKAIVNKLTEINKFIKSNNASALVDNYLDLSSKLHIYGVGLSFITKHIYFQDQGKNYFIYDKWTKRFHAAYLSEADPDKLKKYFSRINKDLNHVRSDIYVNNNFKGEAYEDYCKTMLFTFNQVNKLLGKSNKFKNPGELESFLFGAGGRNYSDVNPRKWLYNHIKKNLK